MYVLVRKRLPRNNHDLDRWFKDKWFTSYFTLFIDGVKTTNVVFNYKPTFYKYNTIGFKYFSEFEPREIPYLIRAYNRLRKGESILFIGCVNLLVEILGGDIVSVVKKYHYLRPEEKIRFR